MYRDTWNGNISMPHSVGGAGTRLAIDRDENVDNYLFHLFQCSVVKLIARATWWFDWKVTHLYSCRKQFLAWYSLYTRFNFLSHDISNQSANHNTDVGDSSGIKLILHNELDQQEICFPTVQWALDHCLLQLDNDEWMRQQMTKYYDAENDEWSEYEKVEQSPIVFET